MADYPHGSGIRSRREESLQPLPPNNSKEPTRFSRVFAFGARSALAGRAAHLDAVERSTQGSRTAPYLGLMGSLKHFT